ncbi:hypothetical protein F53441_45 [Fusarium austroafricanum]|uniref:Uncharacterized protein n=1 Tax=Fusarium austroafricanum TaxID=2364996 RepID=A0A8H4KYX4_9HYPO|nr:hypothetical protein F53441_45 [Fusarium austroafricanum]
MEPTKQSATSTTFSLGDEKTPDGFPDLASPWLSQEPEDQASLKRIKHVWEKHGHCWSPDVKSQIYRHLRFVRTGATNRKVPSKHKLYKDHIDFGFWVILRCMYPEQKLTTLKVALMEKYPGINLSSFDGPGLSNKTPKENKTDQAKVTTAQSTEKALEDDDKFNVSDFSGFVKEEDCTLVEKPPAATDLRDCESKFRTLVLGGVSRDSYAEFLKSNPDEAAGKDGQFGTLKQTWIHPHAVRGSYVESLSSESGTEDAPVQATLSDKQFKELKDFIASATAEARQSLSGEIHEMHATTTKQIKNLQEELMRNRKTLVDVGKLVAKVRGIVELSRMDRDKLDEAQAKVINLEEFIKSL